MSAHFSKGRNILYKILQKAFFLYSDQPHMSCWPSRGWLPFIGTVPASYHFSSPPLPHLVATWGATVNSGNSM